MINNNDNGEAHSQVASKICSCGFKYNIGDDVYGEFESISDKKYGINIYDGEIQEIFYHENYCHPCVTQYFVYFACDETYEIMTDMEIWPQSKGKYYKHCITTTENNNMQKNEKRKSHFR
jgi:hypothetical protein